MTRIAPVILLSLLVSGIVQLAVVAPNVRAEEASLDGWIAQLGSEAMGEREAASTALLEEGIRDPDRVIPALRSFAGEDPAVTVQCRQLAARIPFEAAWREALRLAGDDPEARSLLDGCKTGLTERSFHRLAIALDKKNGAALRAAGRAHLLSEWPEARAIGIWAAGHLKDAQAIPVLAGSLGAADNKMRAGILKALGEIGDPSGMPVVAAHLEDPAAEVRLHAVRAYIRLGGERILPELTRFVRDLDPKVRLEVARRCGETNDPAAIPLLASFLQDEAPYVQSAAEEALAKRGALAAAAVAPLLSDRIDDVRRRAVIVTGDAGNSSSLDQLLPMLDDPSLHVQGAALEALVKLGDPGVPVLVRFLRHEYPRTGAVAEQALAKRGAPAAEAVTPLLQDPIADVRRRAVSVMGSAGSASTADQLLPVLDDPDPGVQGEALVALGKLGNPKAAPVVRRFLTAESPRHRAYAVRALAALGDRASIGEIELLLKDGKLAARLGAAEALAILGKPEPVTGLVGDESPEIREIALSLLEKQGDRAAMEKVATRLDDPDGRIRKRAEGILLRFVGQPDFKASPGGVGERARYIRSLLEEFNAGAQ